jgi:hypothetical protein
MIQSDTILTRKINPTIFLKLECKFYQLFMLYRSS